MNNKLSKTMLCGAVLALLAGNLTSCNNDDVDDLKTRVSVVETAIADLQARLAKALTVGASVTNVVENNGTYVITLSDGQVLNIKPGSGSMDIVITDTEAIISVGDKEYKLPLGSAVNSLIFSPEFEDGEVLIVDAKGASVFLLPRPAVESIDGAEFTVAESHELKSRAADGEQFKVSSAALENGLIKLNLLCLDEGLKGNKYAVSIQMKFKGAVIGSNYFTVKVSDDFSFKSEEIDPNIVATVDGATQDATTKAWSFTLDGAVLGAGYDFTTAFSGTPAGAEFRVAPASKQPEGAAAEKQQILAASLAADGKFNFAQRPGTAFNDNETQKGFLVNIIKEEVVIGKFYVMINDELAGADFNVFDSDLEAEWGGREKCLALGAQRIDIQKALQKWETEITIVHNGLDGVLKKWENVSVVTPSGKSVLFNKGGKLALDELGEKYAPEATCHGIYWFYRGLSVRLPESMVPYTHTDGTVYENGGGEGWGKDYFVNGDDMWMGQYNEFLTTPYDVFYPETARYLNLQIDIKTGELITPAEYTGYGFRFAIGAGYEYLYGVKNITANGNDKIGMLFFNRRLAPEGAKMPEGDKKK